MLGILKRQENDSDTDKDSDTDTEQQHETNNMDGMEEDTTLRVRTTLGESGDVQLEELASNSTNQHATTVVKEVCLVNNSFDPNQLMKEFDGKIYCND